MRVTKRSKIYVAGHTGLVGSAICRALGAAGYTNICTATRSELNLIDQQAVYTFFETQKPSVVINAAAIVGGIVANNDYPADFIGANMMMQTNLFEAGRRQNVDKTLFVSSACIYPRHPPLPTPEAALLDGALEPTNQWYAVAKIAGVKMGEAYRKQFGQDIVSLMPCNLYGPEDNFDLETAHVLPALLRKFHEATQAQSDEVTVWGDGSAQREFLHVDDLAQACVFLLEHDCPHAIINIGWGDCVRIQALADLMAEVTGFRGSITYDTSKPNGTPKKLLDSSKIHALGWKPAISLKDGITQTYKWFLTAQQNYRQTQPGAWRT